MANTFELISSVTVGSGGAASIDFTSIPATYTDLVLKGSVRFNYTGGAAWVDGFLGFNGTTSSYSEKLLYGTGSAAASLSGSNSGFKWATFSTSNANTSNTFANYEIYIPNYAGSAYKSISVDGAVENNATSALCSLDAGLWSNTAAITSITISGGANFSQYSTAYLYGVKNA